MQWRNVSDWFKERGWRRFWVKKTKQRKRITRTVSGVVKVTGSATSTAWHIHSGRPATDSNLLPVRASSKMSSRRESAVNSTYTHERIQRKFKLHKSIFIDILSWLDSWHVRNDKPLRYRWSDKVVYYTSPLEKTHKNLLISSYAVRR